MASVGDISERVGTITQSEASAAINRINEALSLMNTPSNSNNVLGFLSGFFESIAGTIIGFATAVLGFGIDAVTDDLEAEKDFYVSVLQLYALGNSLIEVQITQSYIYRRCQDVFGWYRYGTPSITGCHYPGGWQY